MTVGQMVVVDPMVNREGTVPVIVSILSLPQYDGSIQIEGGRVFWTMQK